MSTDAARSLPSPSRLTDDELTAALAHLAREARRSTAELVAHLAEFDARRLHLAAGYSLFRYCHEVLRLSEHATYHRIEAARAAARFPAILGKIADGSLTLSTVRLLAPHLTEENHVGLLDEASLRSKREVEELVARLHPRADVATIIRKLPARAVVTGPPALGAAAAHALQAAPTSEPTGTQMAAPPPPVTLVTLRSQQPVVVLAPGRYEIRFTVSTATREKLRTAQDLLRHAIPDGDTAEVFDRALTELIDALLKRKRGGDRPSPGQRGAAPGSRHVPAAVRRAVWLRDGARCAFVATSGKRCPARAALEFHHRKPYAVGGPSTVDNIALRCRAHNLYAGELIFGATGGRSAARSAT